MLPPVDNLFVNRECAVVTNKRSASPHGDERDAKRRDSTQGPELRNIINTLSPLIASTTQEQLFEYDVVTQPELPLLPLDPVQQESVEQSEQATGQLETPTPTRPLEPETTIGDLAPQRESTIPMAATTTRTISSITMQRSGQPPVETVAAVQTIPSVTDLPSPPISTPIDSDQSDDGDGPTFETRPVIHPTPTQFRSTSVKWWSGSQEEVEIDASCAARKKHKLAQALAASKKALKGVRDARPQKQQKPQKPAPQKPAPPKKGKSPRVLAAVGQVLGDQLKVNLLEKIDMSSLPRKANALLFNIQQTAVLESLLAKDRAEEAKHALATNTALPDESRRHQPGRNCKRLPPPLPTRKFTKKEQEAEARRMSREEFIDSLSSDQYRLFYDHIYISFCAFWDGDINLAKFETLNDWLTYLEEEDIALLDPRDRQDGQRIYFEPAQRLFYYAWPPHIWETEQKVERDKKREAAQVEREKRAAEEALNDPIPQEPTLDRMRQLDAKLNITWKRLVEMDCGLVFTENVRPLIYYTELVTGNVFIQLFNKKKKKNN
jgi:hypothetical protein